MAQVFPARRQQRCWVHKTANVLDKLPKSQHAAKDELQEIWMAATRADAIRAFDAFVEAYKAKYPKAGECLEKDRDELLAFYDFPAEHWQHLRTTNPIESTFATVRLRTDKTKGPRQPPGVPDDGRSSSASRPRSAGRKLNGAALLPEVIDGVVFVDGIQERRLSSAAVHDF